MVNKAIPHNVYKCGAKTKKGHPCRQPVVPGRPLCHYHGGACLRGKDHPRFKHGRYSIETKEQMRQARKMLKVMKELIGMLNCRWMEFS